MALVRFNRRPSRIGFPATGSAINALDDVENRISQAMDRMFSEPFGTLLPESLGWIPAVDIVEGTNELTLSAELPGLDLKDVNVSVDDGILSIRGEKTEERKEEDKKVYLYERSYGSFQRAFTLPPNVDAARITAEFHNGVLKVRMPKGVEAKPNGRKIEIKSP